MSFEFQSLNHIEVPDNASVSIFIFCLLDVFQDHFSKKIRDSYLFILYIYFFDRRNFKFELIISKVFNVLFSIHRFREHVVQRRK